MKLLYCDSCFLINSYENKDFVFLSQYKECLFISKTQLLGEIKRPPELVDLVKTTITIIEESQMVMAKTRELKSIHKGLSSYDCLALAFGIVDGYCLITDDKLLRNSALRYKVKSLSYKETIEYLNKGSLRHIN